jgi:hypothetical protein
MRSLLCLLFGAACGHDSVGPRDATFGDATFGDGPPPPGLSVQVNSPNGGEFFYETDTVMISWTPHNDIPGSITCEVDTLGGTTSTIAAGTVATSDQLVTTPWMPSGVGPGSYRISVTCTDEMSRTATDESNADFTITPPPRDVSFSGELQPLLTASCTGGACHDAEQPQLGLDLTSGVARAELVDVASMQCNALKLVAPGAPNTSYLIDKLAGSNPGGCFVGLRMPKAATTLGGSQIQAFRDWIANGAPDN